MKRLFFIVFVLSMALLVFDFTSLLLWDVKMLDSDQTRRARYLGRQWDKLLSLPVPFEEIGVKWSSVNNSKLTQFQFSSLELERTTAAVLASAHLACPAWFYLTPRRRNNAMKQATMKKNVLESFGEVYENLPPPEQLRSLPWLEQCEHYRAASHAMHQRLAHLEQQSSEALCTKRNNTLVTFSDPRFGLGSSLSWFAHVLTRHAQRNETPLFSRHSLPLAMWSNSEVCGAIDTPRDYRCYFTPIGRVSEEICDAVEQCQCAGGAVEPSIRTYNLMKINLFDDLSYFWQYSAIFSYIWRLNERMASKVIRFQQHRVARILRAPSFAHINRQRAGSNSSSSDSYELVVGLQVRRGDACFKRFDETTDPRKCIPFIEYQRALRALQERYGTTRLFVASDDESVLERARELPGYRVASIGGFDRNLLRNHSQSFIEDRIKHGKILPETAQILGETSIVDIHLLSLCDVIVGTLSSNFLRHAIELASHRLGRPVPFISLDTGWCALWYQKPLIAHRNLGSISLYC